MSNDLTLERRVEAIEEAVADLRRRLSARPVAGHWLEAIAGSISDEAAFAEALEYGRSFRQSDRPVDGDGGAEA